MFRKRSQVYLNHGKVKLSLDQKLFTLYKTQSYTMQVYLHSTCVQVG